MSESWSRFGQLVIGYQLLLSRQRTPWSLKMPNNSHRFVVVCGRETRPGLTVKVTDILALFLHNSGSFHFFSACLGHAQFTLKVPEQRAHSDLFHFLGRSSVDHYPTFFAWGGSRHSSHSLRILYVAFLDTSIFSQCLTVHRNCHLVSFLVKTANYFFATDSFKVIHFSEV